MMASNGRDQSRGRAAANEVMFTKAANEPPKKSNLFCKAPTDIDHLFTGKKKKKKAQKKSATPAAGRPRKKQAGTFKMSNLISTPGLSSGSGSPPPS
jgi:hypothetical protein